MGSDSPSYPGADTIFAAEFSKPGEFKAFNNGVADSADKRTTDSTDSRADKPATDTTATTPDKTGDSTARSKEVAETVPLRQTTLETLGFFDKKWNHLGTFEEQMRDANLDFRPSKEGDRPVKDSAKDWPDTYFVLPTKKDQNATTGDLGSLTPPVQLLDQNNSLPLEIRDEKGRVLAQETETKVSDWSKFVEKNQDTGQIDAIRYPDGKIRHFKHENGDLTRIETLEQCPEANGNYALDPVG